MKKKREIFKGNWEKIPVHGYWDLPLEPKAMVVLIHGFGEHSGRYLNEVVPFFTSMGSPAAKEGIARGMINYCGL